MERETNAELLCFSLVWWIRIWLWL